MLTSATTPVDAALEPLFDDGSLGVAAQDDELIALEARQGVSAPHRGVQALGNGAQHRIAPLLTE